MTTESTSVRSPLYERHQALGATFTDFGGWAMPVRYSSDLAEHHAVRTAAGIFDISHMAEFIVEGDDSGPFLDVALAGRLSTLVDDQAKYSLLLNASGGILDDVIVYRHHARRFMVVANAGNRAVVAAALAERAAGFQVTVTDITEATALIAVQGPLAQAILERTVGLTDVAAPLDALRYYRMTHARFADIPLDIARTGYTGEDGFELYIDAAHATALWDALLEAGRDLGLVPAGLAARDTLRLEAGMPLYGHELSAQIVPAQAGLGRVVALDKVDFVGKTALQSVAAGDAPVLVGLVGDGKRAGRAGYGVYASEADTEPIGEVTSGALSPTLGYPIAMSLLPPKFAEPETTVYIDVRGKRIPVTVTALPFYRRKK